MFLFGNPLCNTLHFCNELAIPLIPSHTNSKRASAILCLDENLLKPSRRLHRPLAANVHPLDVVDLDLLVAMTCVEHDPTILNDEFSVPDEVEKQCHGRDPKEQENDVHDGILEHKAELIFNKTSFDPGIEHQSKQIDQRLLIVEIEFVFKRFLHSPLLYS